jgi:NAD(P)-dependent dehydrogenase (short-subunit alcohol dehydrogenase family)
LDLSSIAHVKSSAEELKEKLGQSGGGGIDILVCNAGIMFSPQTELSVDGFEKTWAVNCLGHFVFVTSLLGKSPLNFLVSTHYCKIKGKQLMFNGMERHHRAHGNNKRRSAHNNDELRRL